VAGKKESPVTVAVVEFLDALRLDGSERVLGALAIALAGNFEAAPRRPCEGIDERTSERNAEAPFWGHVRDALAEPHP
jgi:hypothetical protein